MINALLGKKFIWVLNLKFKIENLGLVGYATKHSAAKEPNGYFAYCCY
jgi:hypothetical protein